MASVMTFSFMHTLNSQFFSLKVGYILMLFKTRLNVDTFKHLYISAFVKNSM